MLISRVVLCLSLVLAAAACSEGLPESPDAAGDDTVQQARSLESRAEQLALSKPQEAIEAAYGALQLRRRVLGDQHPDTWKTLDVIASLHERAGDLDRTEATLLWMLSTQEQTLGPTDLRLVPLLDRLGETAERRQEAVEAEAYYQRALKISEGALGTWHAEVGAQSLLLARLYLKHCKGDLATTLLSFTLEAQERAWGSRSPASAEAWRAMAEARWMVSDDIGADKAMANSIVVLQQHAARSDSQTKSMLLSYNRWAQMYERRASLEDAVGVSTRMVELGTQYLGVADAVTLELVATRDRILRSSDEKAADDALRQMGVLRIALFQSTAKSADTEEVRSTSTPVDEPRCVPPEADQLPAVGATVKGLSPTLRRCYNEALRRDANVAGHLRIEAHLDREGAVTRAETFTPEGSIAAVGECAVTAVFQAKFPRADREKRVVVIPFTFLTQ